MRTITAKARGGTVRDDSRFCMQCDLLRIFATWCDGTPDFALVRIDARDRQRPPGSPPLSCLPLLARAGYPRHHLARPLRSLGPGLGARAAKSPDFGPILEVKIRPGFSCPAPRPHAPNERSVWSGGRAGMEEMRERKRNEWER